MSTTKSLVAVDSQYESQLSIHTSKIFQGDSKHILSLMPPNSIQSIVTSPPYWGLRDYGIQGQLGLESTLDEYINALVSIFSEARRVLKSNGTFWLNLGDAYTSGNRTWRSSDKKNPARAMATRQRTPEGLKSKDLLGIPWKLAFALQADGWYLRTEIIWNKPNAMPESVRDRPTRSHEYIFLFSKSQKYHYDQKSVREEGANGLSRNLRTVWSVSTQAFPDAHYATFPQELIKPCILASTELGDTVLDPFFGAGTTGVVCNELKRKYVGIELNPSYLRIAIKRLALKN